MTWTDLITTVDRTAAAHRRTGGRTADARRDVASHSPLPQYVTEDVAWDGVVAECLTLPPVAFQHPPTERTRRRVVTAAVAAQARAAVRPSLATAGVERGRRHHHVGLDSAADVAGAEPLAEREAALAVADVVATLPELHRETVARLLADAGRPADVEPATWRKRVERAREAFREAWAAAGE